MTRSSPPNDPASEDVLPIVEETLHLDTRERVTGKVRVSTTTEIVEEIARADLRSDLVDVTRIAVGRQVETVPEVRTEGDVVIVPVVEEILVVEKRLVLKEELHIRRRVETESVEVPVELRKQRAVVERLPVDEAAAPDRSAES
jgi:stress response protein YsnF